MKNHKKIKSYKIFIKNHKKIFQKIVSDEGFDNSQVKKIFKLSQKNIILRLFLNVVTIEKKHLSSFYNEAVFLLIIFWFIDNDFEYKKNQDQFNFQVKLKNFLNNLTISSDLNLEEEILKSYDTEDLKKSHNDILNKHNWFKLCGNIFASISLEKKQELYNYGYLVSLFIFISFQYKKINIENSENLYIYKLNANTKLNEATMKLSPIQFNHLILKTNHWLEKLS
ncbi:hypothetical protein [Mesoplasma corruscae]|uniref:Uncharacterized protein n=1 Tax=Mesoplasma corruscae TaxID=216874 RepID=A0A2S5RHC5_9MOLU|nr:hypothetical protein [Mesoplasma corruscae]PPE06713.1 hypothetical protein MCORR_v1c03440 [Mesoplasma corruscae]